MGAPPSGRDLDDLIVASRERGGVPVDELWRAAYGELKKLARSRLRGSGPLTVLDTTALVNEAYLKLAAAGSLAVDNRGAFFSYASRVMRSVVVDLVRERASARRGGGAVRLTVDTGLAESMPASPPSDEPLRVDAALSALEQVEPRLAKVVEMRYFAGLSTVEIAALLGVTDRTVRRDWDKARLLLRTMLAG